MPKHIDPIYKQYASRIIKAVASTDFYEYFMQLIQSGRNDFQFSNRRVDKTVDETWVTAIEAVIKPMEEIINNPRNFIIQEEIIVNVALAKQVGPDTVQHLAQHGAMVDEYSEKEGVRPNRLMEKSKEDSWNTYENRFVYTLLEMTYEFVNKRYEALFAAMNEEEGAFLRMSSEAVGYHESMNVNVDIRVRQQEDLLAADNKNENIFARIARLHRLLSTFRTTAFAREMVRYGKIKPPLVRTNAIAKNPNFKACHRLWNFILAYTEIGYEINIYDQNPEINESFLMDIYHSVMFDYIILKNYLENPQDREYHPNKNIKHKQIKPHFVTEIIEELIDEAQYDMTDVEVRKVLIEEVTLEQLMQEEESLRRRLVEEKDREIKERQRLEAEERARIEKEERLERERLAKEAEQERQRIEREQREAAEKERRLNEQLAREEERLIQELETEIGKSLEDIAYYVGRKRAAKEQEEKAIAQQKKLLAEKEKAAREKQIAAERARLARERAKEKAARDKAAQLEKERVAREKAKAKEKADKEKAAALEKERLAREKAKAKEKADKEKAAALEKERLAREKAKAKEKADKEKAAALEKERLAREKAKAKEKADKEKAAALEKERLAREKAKAKEKADKEKAAALEKERLAREKAKAKEKADKEKAAAEKKAEAKPAPQPEENKEA